MANITRRRLLIGAASVAGAAAGGAGLLRARGLVPWLRRVASPRLPHSPPGALSPRSRAALLAAVDTLVGAALDDRPYAAMLQARAEGMAGYRELYRRFSAAADRRAEAAGAPSFAAAPRPLRRRVLADLCPPGRLARLRLGLTDADRARFRLYVVQEILDLYAASGAWTALGYEAPPGRVRGLASYTQPPPGGAAGRGGAG